MYKQHGQGMRDGGCTLQCTCGGTVQGRQSRSEPMGTKQVQREDLLWRRNRIDLSQVYGDQTWAEKWLLALQPQLHASQPEPVGPHADFGGLALR